MYLLIALHFSGKCKAFLLKYGSKESLCSVEGE